MPASYTNLRVLHRRSPIGRIRPARRSTATAGGGVGFVSRRPARQGTPGSELETGVAKAAVGTWAGFSPGFRCVEFVAADAMEDRLASLPVIHAAITQVVEEPQPQDQRRRAEGVNQGTHTEGNGEHGSEMTKSASDRRGSAQADRCDLQNSDSSRSPEKKRAGLVAPALARDGGRPRDARAQVYSCLAGSAATSAGAAAAAVGDSAGAASPAGAGFFAFAFTRERPFL